MPNIRQNVDPIKDLVKSGQVTEQFGSYSSNKINDMRREARFRATELVKRSLGIRTKEKGDGRLFLGFFLYAAGFEKIAKWLDGFTVKAMNINPVMNKFQSQLRLHVEQCIRETFNKQGVLEDDIRFGAYSDAAQVFGSDNKGKWPGLSEKYKWQKFGKQAGTKDYRNKPKKMQGLGRASLLYRAATGQDVSHDYWKTGIKYKSKSTYSNINFSGKHKARIEKMGERIRKLERRSGMVDNEVMAQKLHERAMRVRQSAAKYLRKMRGLSGDMTDLQKQIRSIIDDRATKRRGVKKVSGIAAKRKILSAEKIKEGFKYRSRADNRFRRHQYIVDKRDYGRAVQAKRKGMKNKDIKQDRRLMKGVDSMPIGVYTGQMLKALLSNARGSKVRSKAGSATTSGDNGKSFAQMYWTHTVAVDVGKIPYIVPFVEGANRGQKGTQPPRPITFYKSSVVDNWYEKLRNHWATLWKEHCKQLGVKRGQAARALPNPKYQVLSQKLFGGTKTATRWNKGS